MALPHATTDTHTYMHTPAGKQKLLVLEDRLQTRVEGSLSDALAVSRDEDVKALSSILLAVDR